MSSLHRALRLFLVVVTCCALGGCGGPGGKRVVVKGKIVEGGKPLALPGEEYKRGMKSVEVTFYPLDESGKVASNKYPATGKAGEDGSFILDGDDGKGIPVGKYKAALAHRDSNYRSRKGQGDRWEGKFALDKSNFTFDIQGDQEVVIDIGSAGGAAPAKP